MALATILALTGIALAGASSEERLDVSPELIASFDRGEYESVYQSAAELGTAAGWNLAARAATNRAMYQVRGEEQDQLEAAETAKEMDPEDPVANFAWGEAWGRQAIIWMEREGLTGAVTKHGNMIGMVRPIRDAGEKAVEVAPDYPDPMILLGLWHVAIAGEAGRLLPGSNLLFGARMDTGVDWLDRALEACTASNPPCKRLITGQKERGYGLLWKGDTELGIAELEKALALEPQTAEDRYEQERATMLIEGVNAGTKPWEIKLYSDPVQ